MKLGRNGVNALLIDGRIKTLEQSNPLSEKVETSLQQITSALCKCARTSDVHEHEGNVPTSDRKGFWEALNCAC
jgi:hypothetical protein